MIVISGERSLIVLAHGLLDAFEIARPHARQELAVLPLRRLCPVQNHVPE